MAYSDLTRETINIPNDNDSKVLVRDLADIPGGRTLDLTDFTATASNSVQGKYLPAGYPIAKTKDGAFVPATMSVSSNKATFAAPTGGALIGVLKRTIALNDPRAAILTIGEINWAAATLWLKDINENYTATAPTIAGITFLN